jgi:hypothetical protein
MIIDVHTHVPTHRERVPDSERRVVTFWRSDTTVKATGTWHDSIEAMAPVDNDRL